MTHCFASLTITGNLVFILASTELVMTCPVNANQPVAKFAVIHFLHARKETSSAESHHALRAVHSKNARSEGTARQWFKMFKDG
jgi:hypothetical protein